MVTWQAFVALAFDVADEKGAEYSGIVDGSEFMSDLAVIWNNEKDRYVQMTRDQARSQLREIVEVEA